MDSGLVRGRDAQMEPQGVWYKSTKGWVSAVVGIVYFVLDHWGRAETAHDIYAVLKPMAKFFPLISPWIPFGLFAVAVGFFEAERRKRPRQAALSSHISSPPIVPAMRVQPESGPRKMVNVTPEDLTGFFKGDHTSTQAGKMVEAYIGKWMKISGPVGDVSGSTALVRQVTFAGRSIFSYNHVLMYFYKQELFDQLSTLKPGDNITVIGQIAQVSSQDVRLENCEIVDS